MAARASALALLLLAAAPLPARASFDHAHEGWTRVLAAHVRDGRVDYEAIRSDPAFPAYLAALEALPAEEYARFERAERLAFWINAYNAYTVKLVLDHWPVASIKDVGGLLRGPFRVDFIPLGGLRGAPGRLSLDHVEHRVLRGELAEPRVHAAIVCASRSCPALRAEAYRPRDLEAQLDDAMRRFLADPARNRWDPGERRLRLSAIFKWFREDFERAAGSLPAFVARYLPEEAARQVSSPPAPRVEFRDYDWSLNGK